MLNFTKIIQLYMKRYNEFRFKFPYIKKFAKVLKFCILEKYIFKDKFSEHFLQRLQSCVCFGVEKYIITFVCFIKNGIQCVVSENINVLLLQKIYSFNIYYIFAQLETKLHVNVKRGFIKFSFLFLLQIVMLK